jgi:hypothetical protein
MSGEIENEISSLPCSFSPSMLPAMVSSEGGGGGAGGAGGVRSFCLPPPAQRSFHHLASPAQQILTPQNIVLSSISSSGGVELRVNFRSSVAGYVLVEAIPAATHGTTTLEEVRKC